MTSGIYCIKELSSGKAYVGSSTNIERRWQQHRLDLTGHRHCNRLLQAAWIEKGASAFEFSVLEEVEDSGALSAKEELYIEKLEAYHHRGGYNLTLKSQRSRSSVSERTRPKLTSTKRFTLTKKTAEYIERLRIEWGLSSSSEVLNIIVTWYARHYGYNVPTYHLTPTDRAS
jgi:group I intron endonuclease